MEQINEYIQNKKNIEDVVCKANYCLGEKAIKNFNGYCKHCFVNLFPTHPITIQTTCKTKEQVVRKFINTNFDGFIHNKPIWTANCDCTHRRKIDHRILIGNTLLCVETDEKQHKGYQKKYDDIGNLDEEIRYDDVAMIHGGKFIFIRFNPDKFTNNKGVKKNPILYLRLPKLKNEIKKQIERINNDKNDDLIEIIYLYYDNYQEEDNNYDTDSNIINDNIIDNINYNINDNNIVISNKIIDELYIIKDNIISNNLHEILTKTEQSYYQRYICYKCFYTSKKLYNIKKHLLNKKKSCNRNCLCIYSDDDITKLNVKQFKYSNSSNIFLNTLHKITQNILNNFINYKDLYQCKFRFTCYKCFFGTNVKNDILNHFNKENICYKHPCCTDSNEKIEYLNINQFNKYYSNEINLIDEKPYLRHYKCYRCNFSHQKIYNVKKHLNKKIPCIRNLECKYNDEEIELLNKIQFDKKNILTNNIANKIETQNNITNITNITNIIINIPKIIINIPKIIPFNEDWDLSLIDHNDKVFLIITDQVHTTFLKLILENEINNNVIIDNYDTNKGLVFKKLHSEETYQEITIEKIIDESMLKLNKLLHNIYDDILSKNEKHNNKNFNKRIDEQKKFINQKLNEYNNNKNTQIKIREFIHNIYIDNKDNAIQNQKLVIQNKENIETEY